MFLCFTIINKQSSSLKIFKLLIDGVDEEKRSFNKPAIESVFGSEIEMGQFKIERHEKNSIMKI